MFSSSMERISPCATLIVAACLFVGCGGDNAGGSGVGTCSANSGGPVPATSPEMHCTMDGKETKQLVSESACAVPAGALPPDDSSDAADGGASGFGPTMNGSEGDDDDCKYHVTWSTPCITENNNFTVTVSITTKTDGKPLVTSAAKLDQEFYLSDTHLAPNTKPVYKTTSTPGTYTLGPLKVDQKGKWTLRFHIRLDCVDLTDDSPHGHAAFYIDVP